MVGLSPCLWQGDGGAGGDGLFGGFDDFDNVDVDVEGDEAVNGLLVPDYVHHVCDGFGALFRQRVEAELPFRIAAAPMLRIPRK